MDHTLVSLLLEIRASDDRVRAGQGVGVEKLLHTGERNLVEFDCAFEGRAGQIGAVDGATVSADTQRL